MSRKYCVEPVTLDVYDFNDNDDIVCIENNESGIDLGAGNSGASGAVCDQSENNFESGAVCDESENNSESGATFNDMINERNDSGAVSTGLRYLFVTGRSSRSRVLYVFDDEIIYHKYGMPTSTYQLYDCSEKKCSVRVHMTHDGICYKLRDTPHNHSKTHSLLFREYCLREKVYSAAAESGKNGDVVALSDIFKNIKKM